MEPSPVGSLGPRKQARVRLRPDLVISPQAYRGRTHYVVKDPVGFRYYRFQEREHFLMGLMDGRHTLAEAQQEYERAFRPRRLRLEEVEGFAQVLVKAGLAQAEGTEAGAALYERRLRHDGRARLQRLTDLLCIQLPAFDPDRLLGRLAGWLGWALRPAAVAVGLAVVTAALALVATHFETFRARLPALYDLLSGENVLCLWLALAGVKILHEFGHGLACKAAGGEVHEMGVLLLCFCPCLYCNVTDAWARPGRWRRVGIALAGVYVELLVAAVATFVWWQVPPHGLLSHLCLRLMIVCGVSTVVFNANPLLRYDGYFALADWLEVPNLRDRATRALRGLACGLCLGVPPSPGQATGRRRWLLAAYAAASVAYRWLVTGGVLWFVYAFLRRHGLAPLGLLLAAASAGSLLVWPLCQAAAALCRRRRWPPVKPFRILMTAGLGAAAVWCAVALPLPVADVRQTALVEADPDGVARVFVPAPATLERLYVHEGDRVRAGEVLAEFRDREAEDRLEEVRSERDIRAAQLKGLRDLAANTADARERARAELAAAAAAGELTEYARQADLYDQAAKRLVLRAPRAGVVLAAPRPDEVGKRWDADGGAPVCVVADPARLRALVPVSAADYRLLQEELGRGTGLTVTLRVAGGRDRVLQGCVTRLPPAEATEVPAALTIPAGGPVPAEPTNAGTHVPLAQHFLIPVEIPTDGTNVYPGTHARATIHCRPRPLAWRCWRAVAAAFDLELL